MRVAASCAEAATRKRHCRDAHSAWRQAAVRVAQVRLCCASGEAARRRRRLRLAHAAWAAWAGRAARVDRMSHRHVRSRLLAAHAVW
eukprot:7299508-Prymnesium_polylepis.1